MNDKITFSGSLQYVTYVIEKYEKEGYEVTDYKPVNNPKFGTLFFVTMAKPENLTRIERLFDAIFNKNTDDMIIQEEYKTPPFPVVVGTWTLQEQLAEAIELEDYEEAARLRDLINKA